MLATIGTYRFLTAKQVATSQGLTLDHTYRKLRALELKGFLRHFGGVVLPGHGQTPKAYYLTRKGSRAAGIPHKFVAVPRGWSPQMYHRFALIDCALAAERDSARRHLTIDRLYLEYRHNAKYPETSDTVGGERLIPDAALILSRGERSALFFLEMDMETAPLTSTRGKGIADKLALYERYLHSGRFRRYGDFSFFTLLHISHTQKRIEAIRRSVPYSDHQLFSLHACVKEDFFAPYQTLKGEKREIVR